MAPADSRPRKSGWGPNLGDAVTHMSTKSPQFRAALRGIAEMGIAGVGAAVANAVYDATRLDGLQSPPLPTTRATSRSLWSGTTTVRRDGFEYGHLLAETSLRFDGDFGPK